MRRPLDLATVEPIESFYQRGARVLHNCEQVMSGSIATEPVGVEAALRRYQYEALGIRLFTRARHLLAPLERIAAEVPPSGAILDVGCGHGLFANLLALQSPARQVLGIDPSGAKIAVARRSAARLPNLRFVQGYSTQIEGQRFDAITILDVLYLLPDPEKLALLRHCRGLIAPRGRLLLKTNDTRPRWRYALTRLQEELMTRLGLTQRGGAGLYFRSAAQNAALLQEAGFESGVLDLSNWQPYPHRLFVATLAPRHGANGASPS